MFKQSKKNFFRPIVWVLFVWIHLIFLSLFLDSNWLFFEKVRSYPLGGMAKDEPVVYGERFKGLRPFLPESGRIGYFTDRGATKKGIREFFLTQYHLVPGMLYPNTYEAFVLEDFHDGEAASPLSLNAEYRMIYDSGNGVRLFERK